MNKAVIIIGIIILASVGIFFIFSGKSDVSPDAISREQQEAGDESANEVLGLTFKDFDGNSVALGDFKGQPLVLNAWATWCPFCVNELSDFVAVQEEFGDQVIIVAINREESLNQARGYTEDIQITDSLVFLLDPSDSFYRSIGGFGMPETLFINSRGETVFHKRGPMDLDEIRSRIQNML